MNTDEIEQALTPTFRRTIELIRQSSSWADAQVATSADGRLVIAWLADEARAAVPPDQAPVAAIVAGDLWLFVGQVDRYISDVLALVDPALDRLEIQPNDAKLTADLADGLQLLAAVAGAAARHFGGAIPLLTSTARRHVAAAARFEALAARPGVAPFPAPDTAVIVTKALEIADNLLDLARTAHRLAMFQQATAIPIVTTMAPVAPGVN